LETEVIAGLALAVVVFGFGTMAAGLAVGGNLPMIALGLIFAGISMDLFCVAKSRNEKQGRSGRDL
jgi:mannose/fructose/N-acetylgalactosamine-specific phosphotransferase system component IIC